LPLLFNFALEYTIRNVQGNQEVLEMNGTHPVLVFTDDVNMLDKYHKKHRSSVRVYREVGVELTQRRLSILLYLATKVRDISVY
jgi:hypothetical protein